MRKVFPILIPALISILVIIILKTIVFIGYVPTDSMEPALHKGNIIFGYRIVNEIDKGDIIAFKHSGHVLVKRVAATPGETIFMNGHEYDVPDNCYIVLGDNSNRSYDSRYWKNPYVLQKDIVAKIF